MEAKMELISLVHKETGERLIFTYGFNNDNNYNELISLPNNCPFKYKGKNGVLTRYSEDNMNIIYRLKKQDNLQSNDEKKAVSDKNTESLADKYESAASYTKELKRCLLEGKEIEEYDAISHRLMKHQIVGAKIAERRNRFGFFFDTGTGKTLLALEIINKKYRENKDRFLIVCPKTIIFTAWLDDCDKFYNDMKIFPLLNELKVPELKEIYKRWKDKGPIDNYLVKYSFDSGSKMNTGQARKYLMDEAQHFIITPEKFRNDFAYLLGGKKPAPDYEKHITGIIMDESAIIKSKDSIIYRTLKRYAAKKKYVYLMSGKPAPNKVEEYDSQISIIAPDLYEIWHKRHILNDHSSDSDIYRISTMSRYELIDTVSMTLSKYDCLDLPETTETVRSITLDKSAMKKYHNVKSTTWQAIRDKETDQVFFLSGNFMKLRQVASGFLILNDDSDDDYNKLNNAIMDIHDLKFKELLTVLHELGREQVIIWCQFKYEIQFIEKELKRRRKTVVTAYGETRDKNKSISDFKTGKAQYMIAHPNTLKYGATLVNCTYAVYYSISYSFEEYYQSHDRIYRKGQTRPCTYIFLIAEKTIDELMYYAIMHKQTRSQFTEKVLKHLAEK